MLIGVSFFTKKNPQIEQIKQDKPFISLAVIIILAAVLFSVFGSLLMFLFAFCLPTLSKPFLFLYRYWTIIDKINIVFYCYLSSIIDIYPDETVKKDISFYQDASKERTNNWEARLNNIYHV